MQARGHLNFELSINPSILSLTNMHGVLGQNTIMRSTDTALMADQLAVSHSVQENICLQMLRFCWFARPFLAYSICSLVKQ